jgi:hypothetical protein
MQGSRLDWAAVVRRAREYGIWRIVEVSLALANEFLGADGPAEVMGHVHNDGNVRELAAQIGKDIPESEGYRTDTVEYFRLMLRLRERASDRWRLLSRLAFTPSVNEWKLVRLPGALFPLYRVVRMYRLTRRFAGVGSER